MALQYAILGTLDLTGEASGYDLSTSLMKSAGNVWYADRPQIYRMLNRLEDEGLVSSREDPESGRGRKLYSITDAGEDALQAWLESDYENDWNPRQPNLLRLFYGKRVPDERLVEQISDYRQHLQNLLDNLFPQAEDSIEQGEKRLPEHAFYWRLTLQQGYKIAEALIEWCDEVIAQIEEKGK
jgi:PadR family transcriptional regulator AphA